MTLTVGSLFAGIGGFDFGFERAGFSVRWQIEIDPFCRAVLAKHWPEVARFDDVYECGAHNLEPIDVLAGGFPCQPVSLAGKQLAQDDERWLWPEFRRIVCELRPRVVVVENVPGLLVRGMGDVLGDLAACGYDAEWASIRAAEARAPHRRERVWIMAYPASKAGPDDEPRCEGRDPVVREVAREAGERRVADPEHKGREQRGASHDESRRAHAPRNDPDRCGQEGLADAGRSGRRQRLGRVRASRGQSDAEGCGLDVADPDGAGRQSPFFTQCRPATRRDPTGLDSCGGKSNLVADAASPRRQELRRGDSGPSAATAPFPQPALGWPARPSERQHDWEPPRVLERAQVLATLRWLRERDRTFRAGGSLQAEAGSAESLVGLLPDGVSPRLVRHRRRALAALGNSLVPQIAEWIAWRVRWALERAT